MSLPGSHHVSPSANVIIVVFPLMPYALRDRVRTLMFENTTGEAKSGLCTAM